MQRNTWHFRSAAPRCSPNTTDGPAGVAPPRGLNRAVQSGYLSSVSLTSIVRLAAAVLTAALLSSCTGDDPDAEQTPEQSVLADDAVAADGGSPRTGAEPDGALDAAQRSSDSEAPIDPSFLYRRAPRVLPHDYEIGPLQDLLATGRTEREVLGILLSFLGALAEGTIAEAVIAPDRRQSVSRSLQFHLREGRLPHAVRIGALTVLEDQIHVALRVFGDPGRVAGEVYLEAAADGWHIVDLQLDLNRLAQAYAPPAEFEPSATRWLLLSP